MNGNKTEILERRKMRISKKSIKEQLEVLDIRIKQYEDYLFEGNSYHPILSISCPCCVIPDHACARCILGLFIKGTCLTQDRKKVTRIVDKNKNFISTAYWAEINKYTEYRLIELICIRDYWRERI